MRCTRWVMVSALCAMAGCGGRSALSAPGPRRDGAAAEQVSGGHGAKADALWPRDGAPPLDSVTPALDVGGFADSWARPRDCHNNQECGANRYCLFSEGCGTDGTGGMCADVPTICTEEHRPVCGCDEQTYSNSCMAARAGISVALEGACSSQSCGALAAAYEAALKLAKRCCAACDAPQCLTLATSDIDITCGCPTSVEASNIEAVALLKSLAVDWRTLECDRHWPCPSLPCPQRLSGTCAPDGTTGGGVCTDFFGW